MPAYEDIASEGRLSPDQERILYNIMLRQDELGRQPTNMLLDKVVGNPVYQEMLDKEYLTYQLYDHGGNDGPKVVNLIVTLKGTRYCIMYADEIEKNQPWDVAGNVRK